MDEVSTTVTVGVYARAGAVKTGRSELPHACEAEQARREIRR